MGNNKSQLKKFVCISDTHTQADQIKIPKGDVLIHAGDFTYTGTKEEIEGFCTFLQTQKSRFQHIVVIAGNHDITLDEELYNSVLKQKFHSKNEQDYDIKALKSMIQENCIYLQDSNVNIFGYNIYGSPYSPIIPTWAFQLPTEQLIEKWKQIPTETDILITHGAPYNILDIEDYGYQKVQEGCQYLAKEVLDRVKPLYHIFGHTHSDHGVKKIQNTTFINASSLNIQYKPAFSPIVFELPIKQQQ